MTLDVRQWIVEAPATVLLETISEWSDQEQQDALWLRFRHDQRWMLSYCFPHLFRGDFHRGRMTMLSLMGIPPAVGQRNDIVCYGIEAPRSMSKTTLLKGILVHRMVYELEEYVMWLGQSQPEADKESAHVKSIFDSPTREFEELYGPFVVTGGVRDWVVTMPHGEVAFSCRGAPRGTVRGSNRHGVRPGIIAGDDIETPKEVMNAQLRSQLSEWIASDVLQAGPEEGGLIFIQSGTRLHPDSQTARNAKSPQFKAIRLQSIIHWPIRMDLWSRCRELWCNLDDPDRRTTARAFYEAHRAEMDEGAEVLAPQTRPLWFLMELLWASGTRAFAKDQQNEPSLGDEAMFAMDRARRCRFDGTTITRLRREEDGKLVEDKRIPLSECRVAVFLDPRNSDAIARNDFAAISVVARDRSGYRYLLYTDMKRDKPGDGRARMWRWFERFGPDAVYGYEDNGAQVLHGESFEREKEERRAQGKVWTLNPQGVRSSDNKNDRIGRLQPDIENGWFYFAEDLPVEVLDQWRDLPNGAHDDGPDSAERADALLSQRDEHEAYDGGSLRW